MSFFYSKFALNNIVKNKRFVLPYILSAIFTIASFYILSSLAFGENLNKLEHGVAATKQVLSFGVIVIALFSAIFLFYTYSFLVKRRVKEFGLYSVLGMTKKQIARILVLETIYIAVITLGLGLILGVLLDKVMLLALLKLFAGGVKFGFTITPIAIVFAVLLFGAVYFLLLLYTIIKISRLKIVALLKEENKGEREPKARWILAVIGLALVGYGYYTSLTVKDPLTAISLFFFAVLAVIVGTYLIFVAVSISVLKLMKRNKNFYYKPKNFISVSGLLYRMKRNAVGLANICILSTMVLVTMGTTSALYAGSENSFNQRYPRDIIVSSYQSTPERLRELEENAKKAAKDAGVTTSDLVSYSSIVMIGELNGSDYKVNPNIVFGANPTIKVILAVTLDDYKKFSGENKTLNNDEALIYVDKNGSYNNDTLNIEGINFKIKEKLATFPGSIGSAEAQLMDTYYLVVKDTSVLEKLSKARQEVYAKSQDSNSGVSAVSVSTDETVTNYVAFNISDKNKEAKVVENLKNLENNESTDIEGKWENEADFKGFYASFLFIGIFISAIFVVSQVVIMYYKQISEGYEDKDKFEIMRKVGIQDKQVRQSIRSQVLLIFFAPLIVATIHTAVAYPFIKKLLKLFLVGQDNTFLIALITTIAVFAVFYLVVYLITSKVYYRIIKGK